MNFVNFNVNFFAFSRAIFKRILLFHVVFLVLFRVEFYALFFSLCFCVVFYRGLYLVFSATSQEWAGHELVGAKSQLKMIYGEFQGSSGLPM